MKIKGVFFRNRTAYIRFQDEQGRVVRESTGQQSAKLAEEILAKRKTEVAMRKHFETRKFERVSYRELRNYWWEHHGRHTRSAFEYLLPRIDRCFDGKRARHITADQVEDFLLRLQAGGLAASSLNHHRTILNSIFSFAIKRKMFDENPIAAVRQFQEPPGRERFVTPEEFQSLIKGCGKDQELRTAVVVLATTSLRKGELLARNWSEVYLDAEIAYIDVPRTKNGYPKKVPLASIAVEELRRLPSYGKERYLFPARPNPRFRKPGEFKKPHLWDLGKRFRRVCLKVGIRDLRMHDLRHAGPTILMAQGVPDAVIRKLTGHRSRELSRYQHLSMELKRRTVDLIAAQLSTPTGTRDEAAPQG